MHSAYRLDAAGNWTTEPEQRELTLREYRLNDGATFYGSTNETWTTRTVTVETARGLRYQGVSYVGTGRPTYGPLPRGAQVRYRTRLLRDALNAAELARSRTIHHNLYHAGNASGHLTRYCKEG